MGIVIDTSAPGPVLVGSPLTLRAAIVEPPDSGPVWFRFRIRGANSPNLRTVRDYSPTASLDWAPLDGEGTYEIQVSARHRATGETVDTTTFFQVDSRVLDGVPKVTPTANKLVFLYSSPPCAPGSTFQVEFAPANTEDTAQLTPPTPCNGTTSHNVYIAGLRQQTAYRAQHIVTDPEGASTRGPALSFATSALDFPLPITRSVNQQDGRSREGFLLQSNPFSINVATDLDGNVVWYNPSTKIRYLTQLASGGLFVAQIDDWYADASGQLLQVLDVAGNVIAETNAGHINDLLAARREQPITSFHHDARLIDGGRLLVLAGTERLVTEMQGEAEVDVIGDAILVLDADLQIEWSWNAFDHMDVRREALLGETCAFGTGGCPVFWLAPVANDWVHGNSVDLTPDGHILYSARHQDWLLKIDYANGKGSGNIIWRLGDAGDFRTESSDRQLWFSHQHDGKFESDAPNRLIVFDNGNTRHAQDPTIHSRGQVWELDEETRTARLVHNFDLGDYARALGSAAKLNNGNYQFGLGWDSRNFGQSLEFDPAGTLITHLETETQMYRSYRVTTIYAP
ncbi:MAG TPA: aryl-sulfate sulfotransferase [Bryobacteraceae bacterium]|nr:aryl-sulfate sulfotransferase [Bryobacteraceae bacterium]